MEGEGSSVKRPKLDSERHFNPLWVNQLLVVQKGEFTWCMVCGERFKEPRKFNLQRHYNCKHKTQYQQYQGEARSRLVSHLTTNFQCSPADTMKHTDPSSALRASYQISEKIASGFRPFTEGEFVKDCLILASSNICPEEKQKFESISLSSHSVSRRIDDMAGDLKAQLKTKIKKFKSISLALDESCDKTDISQLAIFVRGVDEDDMEITEELLEVVPMKGRTTGADVFSCLASVLEEFEIPWSKVKCVCTDGAAAMTGTGVGLVGLVTKKLKSLDLPPIHYVHCMIHREALAAKSANIEPVMKTVTKIVNYIRSHALNHRQFQAFLEEINCEHSDIPYYCQVRWLSRGKVLMRFCELREAINNFLLTKGEIYPELSDPVWLSKLSFLADICGHLNILNLQLQGEDLLAPQMYERIKAFMMKLTLCKTQILIGNLDHFPTLKLYNPNEASKQAFSSILCDLHGDFERRFRDFVNLEMKFSIFLSPFSTDAFKAPSQMQLELIDLQCSSELKGKFLDSTIKFNEFYKDLDRASFPNLRANAVEVITLFGSTYRCEQFFSQMNMTKTKQRCSLRDGRLQAVLRLASYRTMKPDIDKLVTLKRAILPASSIS